MTSAPRTGKAMDLGVGVLMLSVLGWQGVFGAIDVLRSGGDGEPVAFGTLLRASEDERIRDFLGDEYPTYRAVLTTVPERVFMVCKLRRDPEGATEADYRRLQRSQRFKHLLFPRLMLDFTDPIESTEKLAPPGMAVYFLSFEPEPSLEGRAHWTLVFDRVDIRIWKYLRES